MSDLTAKLIDEIQSAPESIQREALNFVTFLKSRGEVSEQGGDDLLALAQRAWSADWDTPEEDEAWRNL